MPTFSVPYVKRELLSSWHAYWKDGSREIDNTGELGLTELVEAKNSQEAAAKVEKKHFGYVVISSDISRHR